MSKLMTLKEAAQYLEMTPSGLKYHVYESKLLKGELYGKTLLFTKAQLEAFKKVRKPAGRPKKVAPTLKKR